jgi:hypothetical protein
LGLEKGRSGPPVTPPPLGFALDPSLFKSWSPEVGWDHNGENKIYVFSKIFSITTITTGPEKIKFT